MAGHVSRPSIWRENGWTFADGPGVVPDPVNGARYLHQVYSAAMDREPARLGSVDVEIFHHHPVVLESPLVHGRHDGRVLRPRSGWDDPVELAERRLRLVGEPGATGV